MFIFAVIKILVHRISSSLLCWKDPQYTTSIYHERLKWFSFCTFRWCTEKRQCSTVCQRGVDKRTKTSRQLSYFTQTTMTPTLLLSWTRLSHIQTTVIGNIRRWQFIESLQAQRTINWSFSVRTAGRDQWGSFVHSKTTNTKSM